MLRKNQSISMSLQLLCVIVIIPVWSFRSRIMFLMSFSVFSDNQELLEVFTPGGYLFGDFREKYFGVLNTFSEKGRYSFIYPLPYSTNINCVPTLCITKRQMRQILTTIFVQLQEEPNCHRTFALIDQSVQLGRETLIKYYPNAQTTA